MACTTACHRAVSHPYQSALLGVAHRWISPRSYGIAHALHNAQKHKKRRRITHNYLPGLCETGFERLLERFYDHAHPLRGEREPARALVVPQSRHPRSTLLTGSHTCGGDPPLSCTRMRSFSLANREHGL